MGSHFRACVGVGYIVSYNDAVKPFIKHVEEVAHMEDRFDPKTGKKLLPEKIIDTPASDGLFIDGDELDIYEFLDLLGQKLSCVVTQLNAEFEVEGGEITFQLRMKRDEFADIDFGRLDIGGPLEYVDVLKQEQALKDLRVRMIKLGIPRTDPKVFIDWDYSC